MATINLFDNTFSYPSTDDNSILKLIDVIKKGINFSTFLAFSAKFSFSFSEWSSFLHISERTLLRYKKEKRIFDVTQSEKIVDIAILFNKGVQVFGDTSTFNKWIETDSIALGNRKPKEFIDSSLGISLLKDELIRIEHGILG